jgi:hypothetical protein
MHYTKITHNELPFSEVNISFQHLESLVKEMCLFVRQHFETLDVFGFNM